MERRLGRRQAAQVQVYFDCGAEIAVNTPDQKAALDYPSFPGSLVARVGNPDQPVLARKGDDVRIDWGYGYLAAPAANGNGGDRGQRRPDAARASSPTATVPAAAGPIAASPVSESRLAMAASWDFGEVGTTPVARFAMLAYDDIFSIRYFSQDLRAYWRKDGTTIESALTSAAAREHDTLDAKAAKFDAELYRDLAQAGGAKYAAIATLAYRQTLAATKLVADADGKPLLFPKENFSNGCIGTVDVIYPMAPQFLLFSPTLAKALVVPILDYASSPRWKFPFAPHDLGTYPHANGQVYGGGEKTEENQMPVEETGNMLDPRRRDRADGGQRGFRRPLLAGADQVGGVPEGEGVRPGEPALHRRLRRPPGAQRQPLGQGDRRARRVRAAVRHARREGAGAEYRKLAEGFAAALGEGGRRRRSLPPGVRPPGHVEPEVQSGLGPDPRAGPLPAGGRAEGDGVLPAESRNATACRSTTAGSTPSSTGSSGRPR